MANGPHSPPGLLEMAERAGRDRSAMLDDLSARIFPRSASPPDEELVATSRAVLFSLVAALEAAFAGPINADSDAPVAPRSWPILAKSDLLSDPALLDFASARVAEIRLHRRLGDDRPASGAFLLDLSEHDNALIADSAIDLLAARNRARRLELANYHELPAEHFHALCWRIVAALTVADGSGEAVRTAASRMIRGHVETGSIAAISTKLATLLLSEPGERWIETLSEPRRCGLDLHIAALAVKADVDYDQALMITGEDGARLSVLLRAAGYDLERAVAIIGLPGQGSAIDRLVDYRATSAEASRTLVRGWKESWRGHVAALTHHPAGTGPHV